MSHGMTAVGLHVMLNVFLLPPRIYTDQWHCGLTLTALTTNFSWNYANCIEYVSYKKRLIAHLVGRFDRPKLEEASRHLHGAHGGVAQGHLLALELQEPAHGRGEVGAVRGLGKRRRASRRPREWRDAKEV